MVTLLGVYVIENNTCIKKDPEYSTLKKYMYQRGFEHTILGQTGKRFSHCHITALIVVP